MSFDEAAMQVARALTPEALFGREPALARRNFLRLARTLHPDLNPNHKDQATTLVARLNELWRLADQAIKDNAYGKLPPVIATIRSRRHVYTVTDLIAKGDLAQVYRATDVDGDEMVVKIAHSPTVNDLLRNEAETLKFMWERSVVKEHEAIRCLPQPLDAFEVEGRAANALTRFAGYHTLTEVKAAYPGGVSLRAAAWMFNRILQALSVVHGSGYAHAAVTPDHVLINPKTHAGALIDFAYAVKDGQKVKALSPRWKAFYAPEIRDGEHRACFASDIYMAAYCLMHLLGPASGQIPKALVNLVKVCQLPAPSRRIDNVVELHADFQELLQALFGPPQFVPFAMPAQG